MRSGPSASWFARSRPTAPRSQAVLFARARGPHVDLSRSSDVTYGFSSSRTIATLASARDRTPDGGIRRPPLPLRGAAADGGQLTCARSRTRLYPPGRDVRLPGGKRLRFELCGMLLRRSFHAFSGNTAHGARSGAALYRMRPSRIRVTYNGIDFSLIEPPPRRRGSGWARPREADHVLGTAAVLKDWKRIDRLICAVGSLRMPLLHLVVVGDGPGARAARVAVERAGRRSMRALRRATGATVGLLPGDGRLLATFDGARIVRERGGRGDGARPADDRLRGWRRAVGARRARSYGAGGRDAVGARASNFATDGEPLDAP